VTTKRLLIGGLLLAVSGTLGYWLIFEPPSHTAVSARTDFAKHDINAPQSDGRFAALPAREPLGQLRGELFMARPSAPPAPAAAVRAAPVAPSAPPIPYRVAGRVWHDGASEVVLAKGDRVYQVRQGEDLDDGYRVTAVSNDEVTLLYVPLGLKQSLPIVSTLDPDAAPAPQASAPAGPQLAPIEPRRAQLRWEGPQTVREGDSFNVALKVTSAHGLRELPLQLNYDAALLEPVGVRAGRFFAQGQFSYRINPAGSIFLGASGTENVPADADIAVLTFKPIRSGVAELSLSSTPLQGTSGRAVVYDPPAAFRTSIIQ
jgi:hypothetical protein